MVLRRRNSLCYRARSRGKSAQKVSWTHKDPSTVALMGWKVVERRVCAGAEARRGGARRSGAGPRARVWVREVARDMANSTGYIGWGIGVSQGLATARSGEGSPAICARAKGPDSGPIQLLRLLHGKAKLHKVQLGATAQQGEAWPWRGGGAAPAAGDRPSRGPTDYRSVR